MGPKKGSLVKDGKVTKKAAAPKKIATMTSTKTPTKKASKSDTERKWVKAKSYSKSDKDAQDIATYTWTLYLDSSKEPIAVIESAMPNPDDVFWCDQTGPVFNMDLSVTGKDGHKFVCNY